MSHKRIPPRSTIDIPTNKLSGLEGRVESRKRRAKKIPIWIKLLFVVTAVCLMVAIGFAAKQWWISVGTGIVADKAQAQAIGDFKKEYAALLHASSSAETPKPVYGMNNLPASEPVASGQKSYGTITVPRFGSEWEKPLVQGYCGGSTQQEIDENFQKSQELVDLLGVVHYSCTAQVGELGNFAVSGHRSGNGNAFENIHELVIGDKLNVVTLQGTYVYSVIQEQVKFDPEYTGFIDTNPLGDSKNTTRRLMTITTCEPWDAEWRVAVVFELVDYIPVG